MSAVARMHASRPAAPALAYAGLAVATLGWATGFIAGKLALGAMSPLPVAAWRYALAATILFPFALACIPGNPGIPSPRWMRTHSWGGSR